MNNLSSNKSINNNKISYKDMNLSDLNDLIDMYIESFNAKPWNDKWTKDTVYKRLHAMINVEDFYGLCAYMYNDICGMIIGCKEQYYNRVVYNLREFCVKNIFRGQGLGQKIINELENRLKEQGVADIYLCTIRSDKTEGFYKKCNYKIFDDMDMMGKTL